jgi:hypothetical protein
MSNLLFASGIALILQGFDRMTLDLDIAIQITDSDSGTDLSTPF